MIRRKEESKKEQKLTHLAVLHSKEHSGLSRTINLGRPVTAWLPVLGRPSPVYGKERDRKGARETTWTTQQSTDTTIPSIAQNLGPVAGDRKGREAIDRERQDKEQQNTREWFD